MLRSRCLPSIDATTSTPPPNSPMAGRKLTKKKVSSNPPSNPPCVKIIRAGSPKVPRTHLLKIKTHNNPSMKWSKAYPQLYFSRTPHIHHAFHKNSTFASIKKFVLGQSELMDVDKSAPTVLIKRVKLLRPISRPGGKFFKG